MPQAQKEMSRGLEGIVAAKSAIAFLDGLEGVMLYRGYNIVDLAGRVSYEEMVYLLWEGELPTKDQNTAFSKEFVPFRAISPEFMAILKKFPLEAKPMDVLLAMVSMMGAYDVQSQADTLETSRIKAIRILAQMSTVTAAWSRIREKKEPIAPDPDLGHAANFLYMLTGKKPSPLDVEALDMYLVLLADHDLNASTFAARVVISTLSDIHSAICAALGALKGPLHGGANEKAMIMLQKIGDVAKAESYIQKAIEEKEKIMGFGHRVYKVEDPRSGPLKTMSKRLSETKGDMRWYDISVKVAETVLKQKKLNTNVDFYSASVLFLMDIPPGVFTPVFAMSRIAGWTAHIFEQMKDNRLIRPRSEYVGHSQRPLVEIDKR